MKSKKRRKRRIHPAITAFIIFLMITAIVSAAWFAVSPTLENERALGQQADLLGCIEQGGGEITVKEVSTEQADNYDIYGGDTPTAGSIPAVTNTAAPQPEKQEPLVTEPPAVATVAGIGILTIDRINARLPVTEGVSIAQLKVAVGHVPQTPLIGAAGNAVIAGHRSYTYGQYFNRLGELVVGDIIKYQPVGGDEMQFKVNEILEVLPGDPEVLWQPNQADSSQDGTGNGAAAVKSENIKMLTLLTCTPIKTATHRLLVRAELIN